MVQSADGNRPSLKNLAMNTTNTPLITSMISVNIPAPLPARRDTFVAPVPPEPVSRTSPPSVARTIRYPEGIEPIKYAIARITRKRKRTKPHFAGFPLKLMRKETITIGPNHATKNYCRLPILDCQLESLAMVDCQPFILPRLQPGARSATSFKEPFLTVSLTRSRY